MSFLPECDEIIMLENGEMVCMGSYKQLLMEHEGPFSKYIKNYLINNNSFKSKISFSIFILWYT